MIIMIMIMMMIVLHITLFIFYEIGILQIKECCVAFCTIPALNSSPMSHDLQDIYLGIL